MSPSKIAALAVGFLGLFVIVNALPTIQSFIWTLFPKSFTKMNALDKESVQIYLFIMILSTVGFSLALIIFRRVIGSYLLGKKSSEFEKPVNEFYYHSAAISIVGLYFIVHGGSGFLGELISNLLAESKNMKIGLGWSAGIEFILGCCLFFGSRSLVFIWNRLKGEWNQ